MLAQIILILVIILLLLWFRNLQQETLFYTTASYPQLKILEDNFKTILAEIPSFDPEKNYPKRNTSWPTNLSKSDFEAYLKENIRSEWCQGWQGDHVWYNFPLIYNDQVIDKSSEICPETIKLLQQIPGKQIVGYSLLLPNGSLSPHRDPTGKRFGSMAGNMLLTENDSANLIVNDQVYKHSQGKMVIFDSTDLHSADNNDQSIRVILYIDFKVPNTGT